MCKEGEAGAMKFLVMTVESGATQEAVFVAQEANERWLADERKKGRIEAIYSLAGNHGVAMIINVASAEELDDVMISRPACPEPSPLQIYPLADYDQAAKSLKIQASKFLAKMKKKG
jgi:hypothetical protein